MKKQRNTTTAVSMLLLGIIILCFPKCKEKTVVQPAQEREFSVPLKYSGVFLIGVNSYYEWTHQEGVIFFVIAWNESNKPWYGYPVLELYPPNSKPTEENLISRGYGILTTWVERENFIPQDTVKFIPPKEERESLTFSPLLWKNHRNGIWVYWYFQTEEEQTRKVVSQNEKKNRLFVRLDARGNIVVQTRPPRSGYGVDY